MSKSLKNYTTIRTVLVQKEWTSRSLRICFLLMPWQDGVEITDEVMKAVVGWESKLNNFFLKSLGLWNHPSSDAGTTQEHGVSDQQLLESMDKAKADVDTALRDSFNTSAAMRILADLVTESNLAKALSSQTIISLARWVTHIVTLFGLNPEGDLSDPSRIGWSGLDISASAKPYVYPASQLRDKVRTMALSSVIDHAAMAQFAERITTVVETPGTEELEPFEHVLQQFRADVKALAAEQAPAKDLLALCDQLRNTHLWNLGIYLEDRDDARPALVRPLDRSLTEARKERDLAAAAKRKTKLEQQARDNDVEKEMRSRTTIDPLKMFKSSDEYSEWDENGVPTMDAEGISLSKNRRKKLIREWEKQKKMYECWLSRA